jgi:hypothetical protein
MPIPSKLLIDTVNAVIMMHNQHESLFSQILKDGLPALPFLIALFGLMAWKGQLRYKHGLDVQLLQEKVRVDKEAKKNEIEMENRQKVFEEKRILAKEALLLTFQMRDAILMARAPFITGGEQDAALKKINDAAPEGNKETSGVIAAYSMRWQNVADAGSKINLITLQVEAYFGSQGKSVFDAILYAGRELYSQIYLFSTYERSKTMNEMQPDVRIKMEQVIYSIPDAASGKDSFGDSIQEAVKTVEDFYSGYLRNPGTLA